MRPVILSAATLLALALNLSACTDEPGSRHALQSAGYSEIRFTGYAPLACGGGDAFFTSFSALNPRGVRVSGVVCCGLVKSCTIRF